MKQLNFQMTPAKFEEVKSLAHVLNMSMAEFIRRSIDQTIADGLRHVKTTYRDRYKAKMGKRSNW